MIISLTSLILKLPMSSLADGQSKWTDTKKQLNVLSGTTT